MSPSLWGEGEGVSKTRSEDAAGVCIVSHPYVGHGVLCVRDSIL